MTLRDLSLARLCALESVDRTGGIIAAAHDQGVTPPAISVAIHRLEIQLGVALFDPRQQPRTKRDLTPAAKALAHEVRAAFPALRCILDCVQRAQTCSRTEQDADSGGYENSTPRADAMEK